MKQFGQFLKRPWPSRLLRLCTALFLLSLLYGNVIAPLIAQLSPKQQ